MRVVLGEDEALLRGGLQMLLEADGMEVVAAVGDAERLVQEVATVRPDVVITDIRMPPGRSDDGLRAALRIRTDHPGQPVMVLSQFVQRSYTVDLLRTGAVGIGYQLKQRIADVDRFCGDLRTVAAGGTSLDPEVVAMMVTRAARTDAGLGALTRRQHQVLALIAEGRSNTAIATELGIGEKAVVAHASHIYEHLGLPATEGHHRRVLAVLSYLSP
jgi:DNA-binding NarL/FixJ family response regulator